MDNHQAVPIRKKLPAFGAALRDRRRRGDHPLCVHLIYGYKWRDAPKCFWQMVPGQHPELALKPEDYAPGLFDFNVVAGLQVCVFDQLGEAAYYEDLRYGPTRPQFTRFYSLIGELGRVAADVQVYSPALDGRWSAFELASITWRRRRALRDVAINNGWPSWWSDDIERENAKRRVRWLDALWGIVDQARPELASA